jgi:ABC-type polysaccharide/polyol phosphate transport system ATPase subunit
MAAIQFHSVTKTFPRHRGQLLARDRLRHFFLAARPEPFYALRDVSVSVEPGEGLAIVGHNGAGKSTLLSLAAGLSFPDRGTVETHGRVAVLMELGTGFHPDLSGAENIRLNSALIGLSRRELRARFDGIVEFSELEAFIDEPMRTYSAGMAMRLAFSVAVSVDPDILIIDEVLGVGDKAFFAKCVDRIRQFRHAGKTILCVSHSTEIVRTVCNGGLWLDHGHVMADGSLDTVLAAYHDSLKPLAAAMGSLEKSGHPVARENQ